jgi:cytochrome b561
MMPFWNTSYSWGAPAKALHWTIAGLVLIQVALGWMAVTWPLSPAKLDLFVLHKSTGMLILGLMLVRLAWRAANIIPLAVTGTSPLEQFAAKLCHFLLYLVLLLMPISGWIINSAAGIPFRMFWRIPLPAIVGPDKAVADTAGRVHLALFAALLVLLVIHVGAALRHHFVRRNVILARMLPGRATVR